MNIFTRFNNWYDSLQNPRRFYYFITPMAIWIFALNFMDKSVICMWITIVLSLIIFPIAISRAIRFHRR